MDDKGKVEVLTRQLENVINLVIDACVEANVKKDPHLGIDQLLFFISEVEEIRDTYKARLGYYIRTGVSGTKAE